MHYTKNKHTACSLLLELKINRYMQPQNECNENGNGLVGKFDRINFIKYKMHVEKTHTNTCTIEEEPIESIKSKKQCEISIVSENG